MCKCVITELLLSNGECNDGAFLPHGIKSEVVFFLSRCNI